MFDGSTMYDLEDTSFDEESIFDKNKVADARKFMDDDLINTEANFFVSGITETT